MANTNGDHVHINYEPKFADFIRILTETSAEGIFIHHPEVIGNMFEEIVESPNRLADTQKQLVVVPRSQR